MAFFLLALLLFTTGCPNGNRNDGEPRLTLEALNADRSAGAFAQTDPWLLTTTDPNASRGNHGIFLGNGYLGATFGPDGLSGKDTVCYVAGAYTEPGEVLAGLPVWNTLNLRSKLLEGRYSQTLDMRRGLLVTRRDKATITAFLCRDRPHVAVLRAENLPNIQGDEEVRPDIVNPVNVFVYTSGPLTVSTAVAQTPDRDGVRTYYIATYTSREASDSLAAARKAVYEAAAIGFDKLLTEHTAAWAKLWKKDIIIDGDPEAQQLVHKLMFDLLQSVRPGGADSIAPETLSGNFYKGHIFWDADVWMFPALLAQHPELAKNILDYRFRHLPEARRRAKAQGFAGADFPLGKRGDRQRGRAGRLFHRAACDGGRRLGALAVLAGDTGQAWLRERAGPCFPGSPTTSHRGRRKIP